jgi:hypothetical protein
MPDNIKKMALNQNSTMQDIQQQFNVIFNFINSMTGSQSIAFKNGGLDTIEPLHREGIPNFAGLRIGNVDTNIGDITVAQGIDYASSNYKVGLDGSGLFFGFDEIDNNNTALMECDNATIRGNLRARQFLIDQVRYEIGNRIMGPGGGKVSKIISPLVFEVEDPGGNGGTSIEVNDLIICQEVDLSDTKYDGNGDVVDDDYLIKRLIYQVTNVSGVQVTVAAKRSAGEALYTAPANKASISVGDSFAVFGNSLNAARQNVMTFDVVDEFAPIQRLMTGINNWIAWKTQTNHVIVFGNLKGETSAVFGALSGYSMLIRDNLYIEQGNINLGAGGFVQAGLTSFADVAHSGFWLGSDSTDSDIVKFKIYNSATKYFIYDGTDFSLVGGGFAAGAVKSTTTMTYDRGVAGTEGGYWLGQYGTNDYRLFLGSSATKYFKYDNTDIEFMGGIFKTSASGKRIEILATNQRIDFYSTTGNVYLEGNTAFGGQVLKTDGLFQSDGLYCYRPWISGSDYLDMFVGGYLDRKIQLHRYQNSSNTYKDFNITYDNSADQFNLEWTNAHTSSPAVQGYITYNMTNGLQLYGSGLGIQLMAAVTCDYNLSTTLGYQIGSTYVIDNLKNILNVVNITNTGYIDSASYIDAATGFKVNGTEVISSGRDILNIDDITCDDIGCGDIDASGGVDGALGFLVNATEIVSSGRKLYNIPDAWIGDSCTASNAIRTFNYCDTAAGFRILSVGNSPNIEFMERTTADGSNNAYWQQYIDYSGTNKPFKLRARHVADTDLFLFYDNGNFTATGTIKGAGYQSSDGTAGLTATKTWSDSINDHSVTIKNGLITAWTIT